MLARAPLIAFLPVTDLPAAREFYETVLGLPVVDESPFALVIDANGTQLRLTPVPELRTQPFTVAGWSVEDIGVTVADLRARGVSFIRYDGMSQRDDGVWESPSGALVAWFADPDGNVLSLTAFPPPA